MRGTRHCAKRGRAPTAPRGDGRLAGRRRWFLDTQQPDRVPEGNLRGLFSANTAGEFWFRTIVPSCYPIPDDGPVGRLLRATHRHPNRPAHIHFIAGAEGFTAVVTHLFVEGSPYLDDDAVFGVKKSLIREVQRVDDPALARSYGVANPFGLIEFDVVLDPIPYQRDLR